MSVGFSVLIAGYAIGSAPFAWLVARRFGHVDIRRTGSGNVGAANVWRTTRPMMGALVALLDAAKGAIAVLLATRAGADEGLAAAAGVCAAVGHIAPIWLKFRGGKGVATSAGVLSIVAPRALAVGLAVFALTVWRTRYVSLASTAASVAAAVAAIAWRESRGAAGTALVLCALILVRHRANFERLRAGTEQQI
jgi:glycerol-3-phosphate acyltransferase PlsY